MLRFLIHIPAPPLARASIPLLPTPSATPTPSPPPYAVELSKDGSVIDLLNGVAEHIVSTLDPRPDDNAMDIDQTELRSPPSIVSCLFGSGMTISGVGSFYVHEHDHPLTVISVNCTSLEPIWQSSMGQLALSWISADDNEEDDTGRDEQQEEDTSIRKENEM
jgi:hypothetical protein